MDSQSSKGAMTLISIFRDPANVVMMVCQMILGAALAVTLILKTYMFVFSDLVCTSESVTLGNAIRCTQTIELVAQFLILVAGFRFAAMMFTSTIVLIFEALLLALVGLFLLFLTDLNMANSTWFVSLIILALFGIIGSIVAGLRFWGSSRPRP